MCILNVFVSCLMELDCGLICTWVLQGSRIPRPMRNWEEGALSPELLKAVEEVGYKKPSPIQMAAIPIGLQQRDVIGIAETGTANSPLSFT